MTDKMTLILVKKTGHVLGVVTRESDPEGKLEPADVAGEKLFVRFAGDPTDAPFALAQFFVPAEELSVEVVDFDPLVVARPRAFYLNADKAVVGTGGTAPTIPSSSSTQVTVDVGPNVIAKTAVWVQISSVSNPTVTQVRQGDIEVGADTVDLEVLPLDSGHHYVLTLVGGREQFVADINVP